MQTLALEEFHRQLGGRMAQLDAMEIVSDYGDPPAEHDALRRSAGALDLSFRSRLSLWGADRLRFLHGQVTNDVRNLNVGHGCYAALVTAKGRMETDLNIYHLPDELLLDFEPGLAADIAKRLEHYIVADDVNVVDVAPHYGLLSVQGPEADAVVRRLAFFPQIPERPFQFTKVADATLGELYLMNQPRLETTGFDLFVPTDSLGAVADRLIAATTGVGGRICGWQALESARIEAGVPRFGQDMDRSHLPLECGIEQRAVSYRKGCYIGQEVINRIHSIGHVNRELRGLRLNGGMEALPAKGTKLFHNGKEVGYLTSAAKSPTLGMIVALGYVRREVNQTGTELELHMDPTGKEKLSAMVVGTPF